MTRTTGMTTTTRLTGMTGVTGMIRMTTVANSEWGNCDDKDDQNGWDDQDAGLVDWNY